MPRLRTQHIIIWAVKKFPERWYCTVLLGYTATVTKSRTHTYTHLLHGSCRCWKHRFKAFFGIFLTSAVAFDVMSSMAVKHIPLWTIFRVRNSQKWLGERSGECGGWVMTQQAICGSVRYRDAETTIPACHLSHGATSARPALRKER
jgi:hypothetical protein